MIPSALNERGRFHGSRRIFTSPKLSRYRSLTSISQQFIIIISTFRHQTCLAEIPDKPEFVSRQHQAWLGEFEARPDLRQLERLMIVLSVDSIQGRRAFKLSLCSHPTALPAFSLAFSRPLHSICQSAGDRLSHGQFIWGLQTTSQLETYS